MLQRNLNVWLHRLFFKNYIYIQVKREYEKIPLSLYSTRTQNMWRRVFLRHLTQKIGLLRHLTQGYQHVGI